MTGTTASPWIDRFLPVLDKEEIKRRASRPAAPLSALHELPIDSACRALTDAMQLVFHPTTQIVEILHQLVSRAYGHCLQLYPDIQSFTGNVYRQNSPLPQFASPACITGLAGVGKSCLASALGRVLPPDGCVVCPPESSKFPMRSLWKVDVQVRSSLKDMLAPLGGSEGSLGDQLKTARKRAYRDGVALLLADEFQFLTASASANTRITQTLLSMGYCGLPTVYVANYSLLHRLLRRPQEDRDRLLADLIIMSPDTPESDDWSDTLAALIAVSPEIFRINPKTDAPQFHRYCAGIKRAAVGLLVEGYRMAHSQANDGHFTVNMTHIQAAYRSHLFFAHRMDIEIVTQQHILGRQVDNKRTDLWCPLGRPDVLHPKLVEEMGRRRDLRLTEEIQRAAATGEERKSEEALNRSTRMGESNSVVKLPRRTRPTAETLRANAASLRDL
jgi:hypothetical protein